MYEHASKPLVDIVRDLNHFSNNFIAEQLLLALGEVPGGGRDRQVGLDRLSRYLVDLGVPSEQVSLADASGLSHTNRLTPRSIVTVLRRMARSVEVGPEFEISLSVSGRNGTLRRRYFGGGESPTVRAKTGTLDGVSSLAGYLSGRSGKRYAFAIIGNDLASKARALKLEERLVETLYEAG
jgi:D-alanyl-D-alanine carboxypeptidase/D-alanyl-D-alanine-endopeptidase (penicillin-binding protein 4)